MLTFFDECVLKVINKLSDVYRKNTAVVIMRDNLGFELDFGEDFERIKGIWRRRNESDYSYVYPAKWQEVAIAFADEVLYIYINSERIFKKLNENEKKRVLKNYLDWKKKYKIHSDRTKLFGIGIEALRGLNENRVYKHRRVKRS